MKNKAKFYAALLFYSLLHYISKNIIFRLLKLQLKWHGYIILLLGTHVFFKQNSCKVVNMPVLV